MGAIHVFRLKRDNHAQLVPVGKTSMSLRFLNLLKINFNNRYDSIMSPCKCLGYRT